MTSGARSFWWFALVVAVCGEVSVARGDHLLVFSHEEVVEVSGSEDSSRMRTGRAWIGEDRVRYDNGEIRTVLLRADLGRLFLIDHRDRTFSELHLPVHLEDYLTQAQGEALRDVEVLLKPEIEVREEEGGTGQVFGQWRVTERHLLVEMPSVENRVEVRQLRSEDLGVDARLYRELVLSRWEMDLGYRLWIRNLVDAPGFAVHQETTLILSGRRVRQVSNLDDVQEVVAPVGHYEVPTGYQSVPVAVRGLYGNGR